MPPKPVISKKSDDRSVEYIPFGATDKIKLSIAMVRTFIAVPTKSGALPSERDCLRFIMLCKGKRANPFEQDCYLIGYDSQNGPSFSLVCGVELFLKRAEQSEDFIGCKSGIVIENTEGEIIEREGVIRRENEKLLGGWAKVFRKNHAECHYKTVNFKTYDTGKSRWQKDPEGMIAKVALSQSLREAYPTALGGLYTQEEMQRVTESGDGMLNIKETIAMPEEIKEPESTIEDNPELNKELDAAAAKDSGQ